MLNAGAGMALNNATVTGDRNVWLHTTGWDGTTGNIPSRIKVTSNNGNVDVYAQYNVNACRLQQRNRDGRE